MANRLLGARKFQVLSAREELEEKQGFRKQIKVLDHLLSSQERYLPSYKRGFIAAHEANTSRLLLSRSSVVRNHTSSHDHSTAYPRLRKDVSSLDTSLPEVSQNTSRSHNTGHGRHISCFSGKDPASNKTSKGYEVRLLKSSSDLGFAKDKSSHYNYSSASEGPFDKPTRSQTKFPKLVSKSDTISTSKSLKNDARNLLKRYTKGTDDRSRSSFALGVKKLGNNSPQNLRLSRSQSFQSGLSHKKTPPTKHSCDNSVFESVDVFEIVIPNNKSDHRLGNFSGNVDLSLAYPTRRTSQDGDAKLSKQLIRLDDSRLHGSRAQCDVLGPTSCKNCIRHLAQLDASSTLQGQRVITVTTPIAGDHGPKLLYGNDTSCENCPLCQLQRKDHHSRSGIHSTGKFKRSTSKDENTPILQSYPIPGVSQSIPYSPHQVFSRVRSKHKTKLIVGKEMQQTPFQLVQATGSYPSNDNAESIESYRSRDVTGDVLSRDSSCDIGLCDSMKETSGLSEVGRLPHDHHKCLPRVSFSYPAVAAADSV